MGWFGKKKRIGNLDEHLQKLIDLEKGDDHGELYLLPGGHYSHPIGFDAFSAEEIKQKALGYRDMQVAPEQLEEDVRTLLDLKKDIMALFFRPKNYIDGLETRFWTQVLLECVMMAAVQRRDNKLQGLIIEIVEGCYTNLDSLALQDAILLALEDDGPDWPLFDEKVRDMLRFFYTINDVMFQEVFDEGYFCYRANNQRRIVQALVFYAEKESDNLNRKKHEFFPLVEEETEKLYGMARHDISRQVWLNLPELISGFIPVIVPRMLAENQMPFYRQVMENEYGKMNKIARLDHFGLPLSICYMKTIADRLRDGLLYRINKMEEPLAFKEADLLLHHRPWLLDFRRWVVDSSDPFGISADLRKLTVAFGGSLGREPENFADTADILAEKAIGLLERVSSERQDWQLAENTEETQRFGQALELEILFAAVSLKLCRRHKHVNLWAFLRRLKYVFVYDGNAIFIVSDEADEKATAYRLPLQEEWRMVPELERFAGGLMDGSRGEGFDAFGESVLTAFKRVAARR